jgi:hypothetical protein
MDDDLEGRLCRSAGSVAFVKTGEGGGTTRAVVERRLGFLGVSGCVVDGVTVVVEETLALTVDVAVVVANAVVVVVAETGSESCCWKFSQDVRGVGSTAELDFCISRLRNCSRTFSAALARLAR